MHSIYDVAEAFEQGRQIFEEYMADEESTSFQVEEMYGEITEKDSISGKPGRIANGDNLEYMMYLIKNKGMSGEIQLIYVDPPFFSKGKYDASVRLESDALGKSSMIRIGAYEDEWDGNLKKYLISLTVRLFAMKTLLSDKGLIWVHLDWHVSHYVKIIMDQIFDSSNFVNEIIWNYKSGGTGSRSFAKKHDTLLMYSKTKNYKLNILKEKSYNRGFKPYRFKDVAEYKDEVGWYTMVNMKDVWSLDMVGRTSNERTGYATQKPEKLLERIVNSCSDEGDLCADFYGGSGTLGAVCHDTNRRWILCDEGKLATANQIKRLGLKEASFTVERKENKLVSAHATIEYVKDKSFVELIEYDIKISGIMSKYKDEINKYITGDSLSFVNCWSLDCGYDGKIHKAKKIISGEERRVSFDKDIQNENVLCYDVFGNRCNGVLKLIYNGEIDEKEL